MHARCLAATDVAHARNLITVGIAMAAGHAIVANVGKFTCGGAGSQSAPQGLQGLQ